MDADKDKYDVFIVGAGPAGAACALALVHAGLKIAIVDKASFPRDKVCGDALSADVAAQLPMLSETLARKFFLPEQKLASYGVRLYSPDLTRIDIPFRGKTDKANGYVMRRREFDDLLFQSVKATGHCTMLEDCAVTATKVTDDGVEITTDSGSCHARMIVGADGANSVVARLVGTKKVTRKHHSAGLRVYYENVGGFHEKNHIELYFFREILPGYLWIFPLGEGRANVGIGMLSSAVSQKNINLRNTLEKLIATHPLLADRFANAKPLESVKGHSLPLGSMKRRLSGDRFILVGDAAGLIDPFTGEGIGNAIRSGRVAAAHIIRCFEASDFSAALTNAYDREIYRRMGKELRLGYALQQLCTIPWLFNLVIRKASRSQYWHTFLADALADVNIKMRFVSPLFYYRLLFK